jgi:hypothetical protein
VIVAITNPIALAVRGATDKIPIVRIGVEPIRLGVRNELGATGRRIARVSVQVDFDTWGKRLQILKETVPLDIQGRVPDYRNLLDVAAPGVDPGPRFSARLPKSRMIRQTLFSSAT